MPALPPYIIELVWEQLEALLLERKTDHPFGCHRPRIPDRVVYVSSHLATLFVRRVLLCTSPVAVSFPDLY